MLCSFFAISFVVFMFTLGVPGGDYLSGDEEGVFFLSPLKGYNTAVVNPPNLFVYKRVEDT